MLRSVAKALATTSPLHPRAKDAWLGQNWLPERAHTQGLPLEQVPSGWAAGDGLGLIILPTQEQRTLRGGAERTRKRVGSSGTQGTCQSRRNLEPGCCTSSLYTHWDCSEYRGPVWRCTWDIGRQEPMPLLNPHPGSFRCPFHWGI